MPDISSNFNLAVSLTTSVSNTVHEAILLSKIPDEYLDTPRFSFPVFLSSPPRLSFFFISLASIPPRNAALFPCPANCSTTQMPQHSTAQWPLPSGNKPRASSMRRRGGSYMGAAILAAHARRQRPRIAFCRRHAPSRGLIIWDGVSRTHTHTYTRIPAR
jgi:hypothetical protein